MFGTLKRWLFGPPIQTADDIEDPDFHLKWGETYTHADHGEVRVIHADIQLHNPKDIMSERVHAVIYQDTETMAVYRDDVFEFAENVEELTNTGG